MAEEAKFEYPHARKRPSQTPGAAKKITLEYMQQLITDREADTIKSLLESGLDLNDPFFIEKTEYGEDNLLEHALDCQTWHMFELLTKIGKVDATSMLLECVTDGFSDTLEDYLKHGANIDPQKPEDQSVLHAAVEAAVESGKLDLLKLVLKYNPNPFYRYKIDGSESSDTVIEIADNHFWATAPGGEHADTEDHKIWSEIQNLLQMYLIKYETKPRLIHKANRRRPPPSAPSQAVGEAHAAKPRPEEKKALRRRKPKSATGDPGPKKSGVRKRRVRKKRLTSTAPATALPAEALSSRSLEDTTLAAALSSVSLAANRSLVVASAVSPTALDADPTASSSSSLSLASSAASSARMLDQLRSPSSASPALVTGVDPAKPTSKPKLKKVKGKRGPHPKKTNGVSASNAADKPGVGGGSSTFFKTGGDSQIIKKPAKPKRLGVKDPARFFGERKPVERRSFIASENQKVRRKARDEALKPKRPKGSSLES